MREQLLVAGRVKAIEWGPDALYLIDQRRLPFEEYWHACTSAAEVALAIQSMVVRGASAVGIAAAYGVVLGARARLAEGDDWRQELEADMLVLAAARPTSANLGWALQRMRECLTRVVRAGEPLAALEQVAQDIESSDREANLTMAQLGLELIRKHQGNLQNLFTHSNTGALATAGVGTAQGVIQAAFLDGLVERVYIGETRPWLQGARLAAWELASHGVPVTISVDSAVAHLLKTRGITWIVVGADRIAANGDIAAKIGTYQLAVNAMHHGVRFMVVAPSSTIDMATESGDDILLEARDDAELLEIDGRRLGVGVEAVNPVFDVTPADLIDFLVTEKGVIDRPDGEKLAQLMCRKRLH